MKKLFIILLIIFANYSYAQNLVPNPSFEIKSNCPQNANQVNLLSNWNQPTAGTPDYFNICDISNNVGVPINLVGFQYPKSKDAYCGFYLFVENLPPYNYILREYLQVELIKPLVINKMYCVNFYLSLSDSSQYAIKNIGAFFSNTQISYSTMYNLPFIPQVSNSTNNYIDNKENWTLIYGSFIASGDEQFIIIGNFNNNNNTDSLLVGGAIMGAYYYIDDVSVYPCDAPVYIAEAGSNQTICIEATDSVQIGSTAHNEYIYWWTPATGLSNDSIANPKARPAITTTYYLHQKDFKFDETVDSVTVVVEDCPVNNLIIVNAFTPNADGVNDVFHIKGTNIKTLHAKIINRWGQELYKWDDAQGGWDGRYKGKDVGAGAYFYVVTVTYNDGTIEEKKGALELVR